MLIILVMRVFQWAFLKLESKRGVFNVFAEKRQTTSLIQQLVSMMHWTWRHVENSLIMTSCHVISRRPVIQELAITSHWTQTHVLNSICMTSSDL